MSIPTVQVFGKPLEKLIETVSKGIGSTYKPKAIRNEADAKAYEVIAMAQANSKAAIIKADTENEIAERARQRLYYQEMNRQINIDSIVDKAAEYLNETVSEKPVDEDWRTRFFVKAQDITSQELQIVWAKILANEINEPGSFSIRTLEILSYLSKDEAELFEKIVCLSFDPLYIIKYNKGNLEKFGLTYGHLLILKHAGLIYNDDNLHVTLNRDELKIYDGKQGVIASFGDKKYFINNSKSNNYSFPIFSLTLSGSEIAKILNYKPNFEYLEEVKKYLQNSGYEVFELPQDVEL